MKEWRLRSRDQRFSGRQTSGEGHRGPWLGELVDFSEGRLGSFSWEILRALFRPNQLVAVLKAGSSDFTAFQLFTKVSRNGADVSASQGMHFTACGVPASFLLCLFYLGIPTQFRSFFFFTLCWEELNTVLLLFFPLKGKNIPYGLLKANHCLLVTGGVLLFLAPCQLC